MVTTAEQFQVRISFTGQERAGKTDVATFLAQPDVLNIPRFSAGGVRRSMAIHWQTLGVENQQLPYRHQVSTAELWAQLATYYQQLHQQRDWSAVSASLSTYPSQACTEKILHHFNQAQQKYGPDQLFFDQLLDGYVHYLLQTVPSGISEARIPLPILEQVFGELPAHLRVSFYFTVAIGEATRRAVQHERKHHSLQHFPGWRWLQTNRMHHQLVNRNHDDRKRYQRTYGIDMWQTPDLPGVITIDTTFLSRLQTREVVLHQLRQHCQSWLDLHQIHPAIGGAMDYLQLIERTLLGLQQVQLEPVSTEARSGTTRLVTTT